MTKVQKVWLSVFLAMFILPELLWSPVGNFVYSLVSPLKNGSVQILRDNFLMDSTNSDFYSSILIIQCLGLFFTGMYVILIRRNIKHKYIVWILSPVLFFLAVVVFYLFGFSVKLRTMGF